MVGGRQRSSAHIACRKPARAARCGSYRMRLASRALLAPGLAVGSVAPLRQLARSPTNRCTKATPASSIATASTKRSRSRSSEKQRCWHDWSQKHTYGQSRDSIEYALAPRASARANASVRRCARASPAPCSRVGSSASPQPTSAFAPPPQTMARDAGASRRRTHAHGGELRRTRRRSPGARQRAAVAHAARRGYSAASNAR